MDMCFVKGDDFITALCFGGSETGRELDEVGGGTGATVGWTSVRSRMVAESWARRARNFGSSRLSLKNSRRSWSFPGLSPSRNP